MEEIYSSLIHCSTLRSCGNCQSELRGCKGKGQDQSISWSWLVYFKSISHGLIQGGSGSPAQGLILSTKKSEDTALLQRLGDLGLSGICSLLGQGWRRWWMGLGGVTNYEMLTLIYFREKKASYMEENYQVLLLRCSKLTFIDFFFKTRVWHQHCWRMQVRYRTSLQWGLSMFPL